MNNQITPNPSVPSQVVAEVKFPKFINNLGIIPTSYKDSMSYYECLAWLCKYLEETVIPTVNENGKAVEELQELYVELNSFVTHYFDTLDVQQEINNKLDEMVESGYFDNLVNNYINLLKIYDTTSEVITDKANLVNGMKIKTLGYYAINDGGGSDMYVTDTANSDVFQIDLDNGLYLNIIFKDNINVLQIGSPANNTDDDSQYFQQAVNFAYKTGLPIYIPSNHHYIINTSIKLNTVSATGINTLRIYGDKPQDYRYGYYCNIHCNTDMFEISGASGNSKRTKMYIENLAIICLDGSTNNNYALFKHIGLINSILKNNLFYGFGYMWYDGAIGTVTQVHDNHFREIKHCFIKMNDGTNAYNYLANDSYIYNNYINADRSTNAIFLDGYLDDDFEIYENYIDYFMYICTFTGSGVTTCQIGNFHNNVVSAFRFGNKLTRGHICENIFEGFHKENMAFTNPTSLMTNGKFGPFVFEDNDVNYEPSYAFSLYQSELIDNIVTDSCDYYIRVELSNSSTGAGGGITKWRYVHEKGTVVKERTNTPRSIYDLIEFYAQNSNAIFRTTCFESLNYKPMVSPTNVQSHSYVNSSTAETVTFNYHQLLNGMYGLYDNNIYQGIINTTDNSPLVVQLTNNA